MDKNLIKEKLMNCYHSVSDRIKLQPQIGIVLGSGLGQYADKIDVVQEIPYHEIENFPVSTVAGHAGKFVIGFIQGKPVIAMQGRVHYYEGYDMSDVVLPIRLMGLLGIKTLILTNAAGGISTRFGAENLMLITDHISTFVPSPLRGRNIDELGVRFPDMSDIYRKELRELMLQAAEIAEVPLQQGVYIQLPGPNYETPAEIRMAQMMGADAVGMSTACEAMAANHMGIAVCGISCITNMGAGLSQNKLNHEEVQEAADRLTANMEKLMNQFISML